MYNQFADFLTSGSKENDTVQEITMVLPLGGCPRPNRSILNGCRVGTLGS